MRQSLFLHIVHQVTAANRFFVQRRNAAGKKGFSPIQKCTTAIKMLAYGCPADSLDDSLKIAASTVLKTVKEFVKTIISVFEPEYLRPPNQDEINRMLRTNAARGFPGMIGSVDCMHWEWSACPTSWHGVALSPSLWTLSLPLQ